MENFNFNDIKSYKPDLASQAFNKIILEDLIKFFDMITGPGSIDDFSYNNGLFHINFYPYRTIQREIGFKSYYLPGNGFVNYINNEIIPFYMKLYPLVKGKIIIKSTRKDSENSIKCQSGNFYPTFYKNYTYTIFFLLRTLYQDNSKLFINCKDFTELKTHLKGFQKFIKKRIPSLYDRIFPIMATEGIWITTNKDINFKYPQNIAFLKKFFGFDEKLNKIIDSLKNNLSSDRDLRPLFQTPKIYVKHIESYQR